MKSFLRQTYALLPPVGKNLAASARGYWLLRVRYGPETDRLVKEALERESWDSGRWEDWQRRRLSTVLEIASTRVPYYRALRLSVPNARLGLRQLESWPVLEKDQVRESPEAFVADGADRGRLVRDHTSGTTGKPLNLWFDRDAVRQWYALAEARWRQWYGVSRRDRWGILGGQLVTPVGRRRPPFWVWNGPMNQLYLSSYHLAPDLIPYYLEAIRRYRVTYLLGYSSALHSLAQGVLEQRRRDFNLRAVISNAEPLYPHQRETIARAFECPVRETYGMSETVAAASECEAGRLHFWPETGILEVIGPDGEAVPPGEEGDVVATGLLNPCMPLVRYRVGDRIVLAEPGRRCSCGRLLPLIERIEGRSDDVLLTRDGRQVGRLDPVFKASLAVREAQIIQEDLECVRVRYVAAPGFSVADADLIRSGLLERLGEVRVILEPVERIERGASGKFRSVICKLPRPAQQAVHTAGCSLDS